MTLTSNEYDCKIALAVLSEQLSQFVTQMNRLVVSVDKLVEAGHARDADMVAVRLTLTSVEKFDGRLGKTEEAINEMRPWVRGLRWGLLIIGGVLVRVFMGALLWALVQSGAALP